MIGDPLKSIDAKLLVGGQWCDGANGRVSHVIDPATGDFVGSVPLAEAADIERAIDAAFAAQPDWASRTAAGRARILHAVADSCRERREDLASLIGTETGKPLSQARGEVDYALGFLDWSAEEARRIYGEIVPSERSGQRILIHHVPVGVTAAITPWNFPLAMITRKLGAALAAGCTQVIKPAPQTPLTAVRFCAIASAAGIPAGVINLVTDAGPTFADVVFSDSRVKAVSFTGSTEVGRHLIELSARHITRLSLELGGGAPLFVLSGADMADAVRVAMAAKYRNSGQSCTAANRIFVHETIYESFVENFTTASAGLTTGRWFDDPDIGPLIDDAALAKVERHVWDALSLGARLTTGGIRPDSHGAGMGQGHFFPPTVLADVRDEMIIASEEVFGPVAAISSFSDIDELIAAGNASPAGLAAYVCGREGRELLRIAEALEYGVVGINDGLPSTPHVPFGGFRESGLGREGGREGLLDFLETRYVSLIV